MTILIVFAFVAGFVTVLSPCVLPVLPAILSVSAGQGKLRPYGVILGLIISFAFFTLALTSLVHLFGISADVLRYIAIFVIGFFGLVMVIPALGNLFAQATTHAAEFGQNFQSQAKPESKGFWSGLVLGAALGLIWTPCAGPILAAVTTLVATQKISFLVVLITLAYSVGSAVPLLFITLAGSKALSSFPLLSKHTEAIRQGFGVVMILTALALAFKWDVAFQQKVIDYLPSIQIENNAYVEKQLSKLRSSGPLFSNETAAPEFNDVTEWINTPPLTMQALKGKVVLIDFWTYSCINCIRTLPYLKEWNQKYHDRGLVIVGVHTPEFEFEKNPVNVKDAVKRFGITYPVAMDNQFGTWEAYHNSYWPAHYLIDQNGMVRQSHFGEGAYLETENGIRSLLNLPPLKESTIKEEMIASVAQTPETYVGYGRGNSYVSGISLQNDRAANYNFSAQLGSDEVGIKGEWIAHKEYLESASNEATLSLNFMANKVYLVLGGESSQPITVFLDGKSLLKSNQTKDTTIKGQIFVKEPRKYDIIDMKEAGGRHEVTLQIPKGIQVYAFTFGMER